MEWKLSDNLIQKIKTAAAEMVSQAMEQDLVEAILYGSCARGDYSDDSDIDIALLTRCGRLEAKKYNAKLSEIAMELAMKYYQVVNFACLPYDEFNEKKTWYPYFVNIDKEGQVIYG